MRVLRSNGDVLSMVIQRTTLVWRTPTNRKDQLVQLVEQERYTTSLAHYSPHCLAEHGPSALLSTVSVFVELAKLTENRSSAMNGRMDVLIARDCS